MGSLSMMERLLKAQCSNKSSVQAKEFLIFAGPSHLPDGLPTVCIQGEEVALVEIRIADVGNGVRAARQVQLVERATVPESHVRARIAQRKSEAQLLLGWTPV